MRKPAFRSLFEYGLAVPAVRDSSRHLKGALMPKATRQFPVEGPVSPAEALRFSAIADAVMRAPLYAADKKRRAGATADALPHIGTLREKRLHAAIKTYLCPDTARHEIPVGTLFGGGVDDGGAGTRHMVADIVCDGEIFEVQTGGLYPLREKLAWYLAHTPCRVTVVHPIPAVRYLSWIDPADGTVISRRRSPKRGRVQDVAKELYWLSDFVGNPRFSLRLLLIELEEYRLADGWSRDGKRGSSRYERFPTALLGDVTLASAADYAAYFLPALLAARAPDGSPVPFTAADYARVTGIRGKATYGTLRLLTSLALLREREERVGRSKAYEVR